MRALAFRMPSFDPDRHELPFFHVVIGRSQTYSGARIAIITVEDRGLVMRTDHIRTCAPDAGPGAGSY